MLYLDNAATGGYKPHSVQNAVLSSLKQCANPGRSGHKLSLALSENVLSCRQTLNELFDGYGYERVVFTKNCTEALNIALFGTLKRGDHVVTTYLEHNSVLRPLYELRERGIIDYSVAMPTDGTLCPQTIASHLRPNTKAVCVTTASNVTGQAPALAQIKKLLPEHVLLFCDGAQGAGHLPLSMQKIGIDVLTVAGHKGLFAIQGAGALLFSERVNPAPLTFGGTGSDSHRLQMPEFYPDRLESGTLSYPAVCSLREGALLVKARRKEYAERLFHLTQRLFDGLSRLPRYRAYFSPNECGIASFLHEKLDSEELAGILSEDFHIAVRGGLHCAPLIHRALGTFPQGLVRASFSPDQTQRAVDELLSALREIDATYV